MSKKECSGNPEGLQLLRDSLDCCNTGSCPAGTASHVFVVFGASGDLARKKIYPTLWALFRDRLMPHGTKVFGYARSRLSVPLLREMCKETVKAKEGEEELLEQFWAANSYVAGSYDKNEDFKILSLMMAEKEKKCANRLFYLALPPSVFKQISSMIKVVSRIFSNMIITHYNSGCLHVTLWLDQSYCGKTIWQGFCQLC